jgi:hypothetical protein
MVKRLLLLLTLLAAVASWPGSSAQVPGSEQQKTSPEDRFHSSDRCVACHNGMKTSTGEDISIGFEWRASIMANASRDPYWQGSVRRESIDHPESQAAIEDECSTCHMPLRHLENHATGQQTQVFSHLPLQPAPRGDRAAADGVTCSVCHQVSAAGLGGDATFNGAVAIAQPVAAQGSSRQISRFVHPEFGPYEVDAGHQRVMQSSTGGFLPMRADHIREAGLCGSCHTLYTEAIGPGGSKLTRFPEQMPFKEWQHSRYEKTQTCQYCHMPEIKESVPVTALYGPLRQGARRHVFVGANFVMEGMLNEHRDELSTEALPQELDAAMKRTTEFLRTEAARVTIPSVAAEAGRLSAVVLVQNLSGHKLPTAYPSRRAWLHVTIRDASGRVLLESGALHPDGSIEGNDNDRDPLRYEPHYREITSGEQVEIYEPILGDAEGRVTTGLLSTARYLKDNRLLPQGFDKQTADKDIQVVGDAARDPGFTDSGSTVRYTVDTANATGPFTVDAEVWYQPIGYRWAHNLGNYHAAEPQRMVAYYEAASQRSATLLASAHTTR